MGKRQQPEIANAKVVEKSAELLEGLRYRLFGTYSEEETE
jgi:hypothetical protein